MSLDALANIKGQLARTLATNQPGSRLPILQMPSMLTQLPGLGSLAAPTSPSLGAPTASGTPTSTGPAQPGLRGTTVYPFPYTGTPANLRTVRGVTLQAPALATLLRLQKSGVPILRNIISSYRSYDQQVGVYNHNTPLGLPAARAGSSYHEQGLAIDVNSGFLAAHPEVRAQLERLGWNSGASFGDPNHFTLGVVG